MRRLLCVTLAAALAASMLFVPGASAAEVDALAETDAEAIDTDAERPERPKIRCRGHVNELNGDPAITCRWTETTHPDAAGYKIVRRGGGERVVAHRTDDLSATRFTDTDIEFGTRYRYRVIVVDENGRKLQKSRWNKAIVVSADIERLQMECDLTDAPAADADDAEPEIVDTAPHTVLCQWRAAETPAAVEYQLWRRVKGEHRELVASLDIETLSHIDEVPAEADKVVYAVLALDADGEIIGRSGLSKIRFAAGELV